MEENPKAERLKKLFTYISKDFIKKDEAVRLFSKVLAAVKKTREDLNGKITSSESRVEKKLGRLNELLEVVDREMGEVVELTKDYAKNEDEKVLNRLLLEIDALASKIPDLTPFHESFARIVDKIPEPETPESIREKLETLEEGERLPIDVIEDLREELDELKKRPVSRGGGGGGVVGGRELVKSYDLSPLLDGVTKSFNLPANWTILSVSGTSFPYTYRRLVDYTFTTQSITFTSEITADTSLASGQTIEIIYVVA